MPKEFSRARSYYLTNCILSILAAPNRDLQLIRSVTEMSRVCQVTGKRPAVGNHRSHANNAAKRRFLPNLKFHRFWVESEERFVKLRVTTKAMRIIDKRGIDAVLSDIRAQGQKV